MLAVGGALCLVLFLLGRPLEAQQRPLLTQDPESIGSGRVLIEGGLEYDHDQDYPASGLKGDLWRVPVLGVIVGISSIAELQVYGAPFDHLAINERRSAPLSSLLTGTGLTTSGVEDLVVGTKVRLLAEAPGRPAIGFRFATKVPMASNESGLGLNTTDFFASVLAGKTVESIRVVGNFGAGILGDPTSSARQNDVLTYGVSIARAITDQTEVVGELNGRISTRAGMPPPGTESRGVLKLGGRYTRGPVRFDAGLLVGLTSADPTIGLTGGFTYVFNAFTPSETR